VCHQGIKELRISRERVGDAFKLSRRAAHRTEEFSRRLFYCSRAKSQRAFRESGLGSSASACLSIPMRASFENSVAVGASALVPGTSLEPMSLAREIAKWERMFDDGLGTVTRRPGVWKPLTELSRALSAMDSLAFAVGEPETYVQAPKAKGFRNRNSVRFSNSPITGL
jgi:hypothetical protein